MIYTIYRDGVAIGQVACSPKQLAKNVPDGCEAREGAVSSERPPDLDAEIRALAREKIAAIEAGQVRTLREALLGDPAAIQRLRDQEPAIAAAREVLRRPQPSSGSSAPTPAAPAKQPAE